MRAVHQACQWSGDAPARISSADQPSESSDPTTGGPITPLSSYSNACGRCGRCAAAREGAQSKRGTGFRRRCVRIGLERSPLVLSINARGSALRGSERTFGLTAVHRIGNPNSRGPTTGARKRCAASSPAGCCAKQHAERRCGGAAGASGLVGVRVARELVRAGFRVVAGEAWLRHQAMPDVHDPR